MMSARPNYVQICSHRKVANLPSSLRSESAFLSGSSTPRKGRYSKSSSRSSNSSRSSKTDRSPGRRSPAFSGTRGRVPFLLVHFLWASKENEHRMKRILWLPESPGKQNFF